jgi:hypothetical protein
MKQNLKENTEIIENKNISEWNDKIELVVKNIGEMSTGYKIMHIEVAQNSFKSYKKYMMLGIILGPLAGTLSSIGAIIESNLIIPIIVTVISFLSGIIVAIIKFGKFEELTSVNKNAAAKYTSLECNVRRQLSLFRNNRINPIKYMEWLETKFDELFSAAPLIPTEIYNKYIQFAQENNKIIPKKYDTTIEINKEENIQNILNISEINTQPNEQPIQNNKQNIKRTNTLSNIPELKIFTDGMMKYEIERMFGLNQK